MGNCFRKPSYPKLNYSRKAKLNEILEELFTKVAIVYSNPEILHLKTAVRTMVERIVTRVNERGRFKIARIVPCGSMAEQTAVLKFDYENEMYTEFDFLADLDYSPNIICRDHGCGQCVKVSELPVLEGAMSKLQEYDDEFGRLETVSRSLGSDGAMSTLQEYGDKYGGTVLRSGHLFWREINTCLGSDCQCFSVQYDDNILYPSYSYK